MNEETAAETRARLAALVKKVVGENLATGRRPMLGRLTVTLSEDPADLLVLPPIDGSTADSLMLLKRRAS